MKGQVKDLMQSYAKKGSLQSPLTTLCTLKLQDWIFLGVISTYTYNWFTIMKRGNANTRLVGTLVKTYATTQKAEAQ